MKKLILATLLTLLSFNANARCFSGDDYLYTKCTIFEATKAKNSVNELFVIYTDGVIRGISEKIKAVELEQKINNIEDVADCLQKQDFTSVNNYLYEKIEKENTSLEADYYSCLTDAASELFYQCLEYKQFLNSISEIASKRAKEVIEKNHPDKQ